MVKRVQLSHGQFYSFTEWLKKEGAGLWADGPKTYKEIALKAQDALGFAISDSGVKSGLEVTGLLETHNRAKGERDGAATEKALKLLAKQIWLICSQMGIPTIEGIEELRK